MHISLSYIYMYVHVCIYIYIASMSNVINGPLLFV